MKIVSSVALCVFSRLMAFLIMFIFRCNFMQNLVDVICEDSDLDCETLTNIAVCLNVIFGSQFEDRVFPEEASEK